MATDSSSSRQKVMLRNNSGQALKTFGQVINPGDDTILGEFEQDNLQIKIEDVDSGADLCIQDFHLRNKAKYLVAQMDTEGKLTLQDDQAREANAENEDMQDDRGTILERQQGTRSTISNTNQTKANLETEPTSGATGLPDVTPGATGTSVAMNPEARNVGLGHEFEEEQTQQQQFGQSSGNGHQITIMNVSNQRILVNGEMCAVGELTAIGKFPLNHPIELSVQDELGQNVLMTQEVTLQTRDKHLVALNKTDGTLAIRKQNRSGMPYDGELNQEEEDDFVAAQEDFPENLTASKPGISGVTQDFQEQTADSNTSAWQDPQVTSHATASGEQGPSLTSEIEEPAQMQTSAKGEESRGLKRQQEATNLEELPSQGNLQQQQGDFGEGDLSIRNFEQGGHEKPADLGEGSLKQPELQQQQQTGSLSSNLEQQRDLEQANEGTSMLGEGSNGDFGEQQGSNLPREQNLEQLGSNLALEQNLEQQAGVERGNFGARPEGQTTDMQTVPTTVISVPVVLAPGEEASATIPLDIAKPSTESVVPLSTGSIISGSAQGAADTVSQAAHAVSETVTHPEGVVHRAVDLVKGVLQSVAGAAKSVAEKGPGAASETGEDAYGAAKDRMGAVESTAEAGSETAAGATRRSAADSAAAGADLATQTYDAAKHNVASGVEDTAESAKELGSSALESAKQTAVSGAEKASQVAEGTRETAASEAEQARELGASAIDTAAAGAGKAREAASSVAATLKHGAEAGQEYARDLAATGAEAVRETAEQARARAARALEATREMASSGVERAQGAAARTADLAMDAGSRAAATTSGLAADYTAPATEMGNGAAAQDPALGATSVASDAASATATQALESGVHHMASGVSATQDTAGAAVQGARESASGAAESTKSYASNAAESAKDTAAGVAESAKDTAAGVADTAQTYARKAAQGASQAAETVKETAKPYAETVQSYMGEAAESAKSTTSSAFEGAKSYASEAGQKAQEGMETAKEAATSSTPYDIEKPEIAMEMEPAKEAPVAQVKVDIKPMAADTQTTVSVNSLNVEQKEETAE